MIYELLNIPVLPRLKVSIRIVSGTEFTSSILCKIFMDWIGLDRIGSAKMDPCPNLSQC